MLKSVTRTPERLLSLALFKGLGKAELGRFASGATEIPVEDGSIVFREGDLCTGLHFVVEGQVKLTLQTERGHEKVVQLIGAGESFGVSILFLGERHIMTAEAIADTTLLHLEKEVVLLELGRNPEFGQRVIRELCHQLHQRTLDLQSYMLLSGTQRVVSYLLSLVPDGINGSGAAIMLPAKKGIIASRLNLTHEHFSRILHDLAAGALIEVVGRTVRILDVGRLRSHTNG